MKKLSVIFVLVLAGAILSHGRPLDRQRIIDSLENVLSTAPTAADSVRVLYDLFDISPSAAQAEVAERLLSPALHTTDATTQFDIMRRLATKLAASAKNQERIDQLIEIVAARPQSPDQRVTLAFLRVESCVAGMDTLSSFDRRHKVYQLLRDRTQTSASDPYNRIELLFTICKYLQTDINSQLLTNYLDELGKLLEGQPYPNNVLDNLYYVQASLVYTVAGHQEKALEACRELEKIISRLEDEAAGQGRRFRTYDRHRYVVMRRMLTNYKSLSEEEVDSIYSGILALVADNSELAEDFNHFQRPTIYYLMAKKLYSQALPLLKKQVKAASNKPYLYQLYNAMLEAATATGDQQAMLTAALGLNDIYGQILEERQLERSLEMKILDRMHDIQASNTNLQSLHREQELRFHHSLLKVVTVAGVILLAIIVGLLLLIRRSRQLSKKLAESNRQLMEEHDSMQDVHNELIEARDHARRADRHKTEFINNMSHEIRTPLNAIVECSHLIVDNVPEEKRPYLKRYADMLDVSVDMLQAFVSDVLNIASMENQSLEIRRKPESVNAICRIAVDAMRKHTQPGVEMNYLNSEDTDIQINTDARRVEQVLINLLNNGAKFTEHGYVNLSYRLDPLASTIIFVVEDSGIGVPKGKEEIIFERFEKLSNLTSGMGLGLNISRMVAERLGGSLHVDTTYPGPGARFLFTIPL